MRLGAQQVSAIKSRVLGTFGPEARVWLFGSRANDGVKGGDIDLYFELPEQIADVFARTVRLNGSLQMALGEQRIDIVTHVAGSSMQSVHLAARAEGVLL